MFRERVLASRQYHQSRVSDHKFRDAEYIEAVLILPPKVQSIVFVNPKDFNCGHDLHTTIQLLIVKAQGAVSQKYTSLIKQLNPLAKFNPIAKIPP